MLKKIVTLLFCSLLLASCASRKKIVYFQNISASSVSETTIYEPRLKPDDLLMIIVSAPEPEAAKDFNLPAFAVMSSVPGTMNIASSQLQYQTYLIDNQGYIQFPVIGALKLGGLTRQEALALLKGQLIKYINNPIVTLRIMNFKVSVMGEVLRPGVFPVTSERVTLPEAITMAGDMTIYGSRTNVLVIREINGQKTYNFVDMTQADFINSPFYYLSQNDLVYVEPNKTKVNSSVVGPNIQVALTGISLLITIVALVIR